ncbi:MAG TPA: tetratricopeptide repeat protein [Gemmata sp.]|jgi:serine/threonine protein kinase|nr:tetratricopeptide repeat protein [Gemmata sp.]
MPIDPVAVKSLFLAAATIDDPAARAALLAERCGSDVALLARVYALLAANERAMANKGTASYLADGPGADPDTVTADGPKADPEDATTDQPGQAEHIGAILAGKYKLVEEIGEGGMGAVYLAQQTEPVKRAVAVKVIKAGMDSKAVLTRFEAERQALAMMDHPNIARVLDAGTTESGRPFFVMELVKGVPITQYCDERKLTPRQRLALFVPVCAAIQHAHQKGVIHRDIKPNNVLVALYDDRPVPKVIDFGVAKAAGQSLTDKTLMTGFGAVVGTPEYMSPEQASLNNLDIDTRSDVYSLGVLLYELLTGTTPVDKKSLGKAALLEVLRIVREVEAPRPSSKLSTIDTLPNVAANRGTEPARLSRLMKGELDWLVMKALEKDRARRYETANGFAADVLRYLAGEAVLAHPPGTAYQLKKFIRRNQGQVIAASLVLVALLAGIAGTTWGLVEAMRQGQIARDEAIAKEQARQAESEQREKAEEEKKIAQSVRDFLQNKLLAQADTNIQAARQLALPLFEETLKLHKAKLGSEHPDTFASMNNLAAAYHYAGKADLAVPLFEETLKLRKANLGPEHPDTLATMYGLALAYQLAGKPELAVPLAEETLKIRKAKLGPEHSDSLNAMDNLANAYRAAGKADLAVPLSVEKLTLCKAKVGPEHRDTLTCMNNLATSYRDAGKLDLALSLFEETLKLMKVKLGPDDPDTLRSMLNLAWTYHGAGKPDLALPLFEESLKLRKAKLGPENYETIRSMNYLASAYQSEGKLDLALPLLEQTLKYWIAALGPNHRVTLDHMENLAQAYLAAAARQAWFGQDQDFFDTCRRALAFAAGTQDPLVADRVAKTCSLRSLSNSSRRDATLALARSAVQLGAKHQLRAYFKMAQGMAEYRVDHFAEADALLAAAITEGESDPYIPGTGGFYRAMSLFRQGKRDEARQLAATTAATMKPLPKDEKNPLADQGSHDDLILWLAYKEAKELIGLDAAPAVASHEKAPPPREKK